MKEAPPKTSKKATKPTSPTTRDGGKKRRDNIKKDSRLETGKPPKPQK